MYLQLNIPSKGNEQHSEDKNILTSSTFKAIFHLSELGRIVKGFLYKVFHFVPLPRISAYCSGPKFWLPQKKGNYKVFEKCLEHYACCYK